MIRSVGVIHPTLSQLSHRYETLHTPMIRECRVIHPPSHNPLSPQCLTTILQNELNPTHVQTFYSLNFPKCKELNPIHCMLKICFSNDTTVPEVKFERPQRIRIQGLGTNLPATPLPCTVVHKISKAYKLNPKQKCKGCPNNLTDARTLALYNCMFKFKNSNLRTNHLHSRKDIRP
jgi:hypothetical protein